MRWIHQTTAGWAGASLLSRFLLNTRPKEKELQEVSGERHADKGNIVIQRSWGRDWRGTSEIMRDNERKARPEGGGESGVRAAWFGLGDHFAKAFD